MPLDRTRDPEHWLWEIVCPDMTPVQMDDAVRPMDPELLHLLQLKGVERK